MLRTETIESWRIHNPDLDTSPMTIVALIKEISEGVGRAVDEIYAHSPLSHADVELLVPLRYQTESVTAIRLAERLGMSRAGVSKTLSRLEERGIVVRMPDPTDKRSASVHLTAHGERLVDDLFPRELASHAAILDHLGPDREHVITALELLAQAFR
ncbi:MarR family winged helix-turn-helix transcriptional regulator [Rhodococcus sovatensis]|uniref:MarR family transcriptional regulator n=1 Tax=Rhodococcus sovatensis TaxID=1805840 RepID=A0ABZ2PHF3_9NOCA